MSHGPLAGIVWWGECSRVVRERWWRFLAEDKVARGLLVLYCVFPQKGIVLGVERLPCIRV